MPQTVKRLIEWLDLVFRLTRALSPNHVNLTRFQQHLIYFDFRHFKIVVTILCIVQLDPFNYVNHEG